LCHPHTLHMHSQAFPLFAALKQRQYIPRNGVLYSYLFSCSMTFVSRETRILAAVIIGETDLGTQTVWKM
jgi:hypothetical protein